MAELCCAQLGGGSVLKRGRPNASVPQRGAVGDGAQRRPLTTTQVAHDSRPVRRGSCNAFADFVSKRSGFGAETEFMSELRVATLLHRRLGYDRLLNGEAPEIVYLDEEGRLFSAPVFDDAARTLRFKLASTDMRGATYSLLLHHCDFQFTASHTDGTIVLSENGEFSSDDGALLQKLLRHLETASKRTLVCRPRSNNSLWQRLFKRMRLAKAL
jgi:hypothetical protein